MSQVHNKSYLDFQWLSGECVHNSIQFRVAWLVTDAGAIVVHIAAIIASNATPSLAPTRKKLEKRPDSKIA